MFLFVLHVSEAYSCTEQTLDLYIFSVVLVWRVVDFQMLVSLLCCHVDPCGDFFFDVVC